MVNKVIVTPGQLFDLSQRVVLYSVRLAFCLDLNNPTSHISASGVLVKLSTRYFILTAGHVAHYVQSHGDPYVSVTDRWHSFRPKVIQTDFRFHSPGGKDWGYMELTPSDARVIESKKKVFASTLRISAISPQRLLHEGIPLFLFGFPAHYAQDLNKYFFLGSRILGEERPAFLPQADENNYVDLHIERDKMDLFDEAQITHQAPEKLGGASGSGLWAILSRNLDPESIHLIGIATYNSQENWSEGDSNVGFVRATRVCKTLVLIRGVYPELAPEIDRACPDEVTTM